jgi:hypothetical protein
MVSTTAFVPLAPTPQLSRRSSDRGIETGQRGWFRRVGIAAALRAASANRR